KLLSKQKTDLLNDVVIGKSTLHNKILSDGFIMQTIDRNQYTKDGFIDAYITHPKTKIESLSAEDFRIVTSNENTIVLTYIENIKLEGNEEKSVFVNETYSKVKDSWKLI